MVDLSAASLDDFQTRRVVWKPVPLRRYERAEDYPVHCFPPVIRDAVEEVAGYVKAPPALVAGCALSTASASVQSRFSVARDEALIGPASLYILTVAESGERKSTIDRMMMVPIREWEAQQALAAKPILAKYEADLEAWQIRGAELKREMRSSALGGITTGPQFNPLEQHELDKPQPPRIPRMLRGDDTPEALAMALAEYPIAAVISAEAGVIFGSHSMGADSVTRNLGQANVMWDGGPIDQGRVTRERVRIEQARVTMGLQVQPAVLQNFVQKTGGLARGIGYFARFLFSQPESTQGTRYYARSPADMPALRAFHDRARSLLSIPAAFDDHDMLVSDVVRLDEAAHECWFRFHDEVEEDMGFEEQFSGIRDVASKAAENAARLACCLHLFQHGSAAPIGREIMADACSLMRWYLDEAVRFGRAHDLPEEVRNAELLEGWLAKQIKALRRELTVNEVRQKGPNQLRVRAKLDAALELLEDHGRLRVFQPSGTKKRYIYVAPTVLREWLR